MATILFKVIFGLAFCGLPLVFGASLKTSPFDPSDVFFYLWTRSNPGDNDYYTLVYEDQNSLAASPLNVSRTTYVMFHGYTSAGLDWWILDGKSRILSIEDSNIISVDYGSAASGHDYELAIANMYKVANYTASYIDWLAEFAGLQMSSVELVGYSLGGQTAGMTAYYVISGTISRVTGLDPAGPGFHNVTNDGRLDSSDADFVDVIHTNSCPYLDGCYGYEQSSGHVDFYPNGGEHQPLCVNNSIPGGNIVDLFDCSHERAPMYWLESILIGYPNGTELEFVSWPCQSWEDFEAGLCPSCGVQGCPNMGFHVDRRFRGVYYLRTKASSPFALGDSQEAF